jgi:hypothetical protein
MQMQYPTGAALPRMNITMTEVEKQRLELLAASLGVKPSRAIAMAVVHMLGTLRGKGHLYTELLPDQELRGS